MSVWGKLPNIVFFIENLGASEDTQQTGELN